MRILSAVTTSRADYGILVPVLRRIEAEAALKLQLLVSGMHLMPEFGNSVAQIEADGFPISARVDLGLNADTPEAITRAMGRAAIGFADVFARSRPEILFVLGDRFEMHAAALAALPFKIPVAHLHGGELSSGAMDDALRHSMTKLSHLHFVSTEAYAARVRQLGEEPWRITVCGAPGLDHLRDFQPLPREQLAQRVGLPLDPPPLLVTFHPVTLEFEQTDGQIGELLAALAETGRPVIFTLPNADTSGRLVLRRIREYCQQHADARLVDNLGTRAYFSLMTVASAMVGNSSSGMIEAASFRLPVVNVGTRQLGRVRARNVIDVGYDRAAVRAGLARALSEEFRGGLSGLVNPYARGDAAGLIVRRLRDVPLDERLTLKRFADLAPAGMGE